MFKEKGPVLFLPDTTDDWPVKSHEDGCEQKDRCPRIPLAKYAEKILSVRAGPATS